MATNKNLAGQLKIMATRGHTLSLSLSLRVSSEKVDGHKVERVKGK
jgi:hypothetical protein